MIDLATLISSCPAPVSTAENVSSALAWLATAAAYANDHIGFNEAHDYQPIKTRSYIYFDQIKLSSTDYVDINNKLMHIKDMLLAIQALDAPAT